MENKIVIGIDQSYTRTGITVLENEKIMIMDSIKFREKDPNTLKREQLKDFLNAVLDVIFTESYDVDIKVITERVRLKSQGFLNQAYIMSTGALVATIIDVCEGYLVPVYSVDTRSWKSQIVGSSKPLGNKYGINPEKYRTILYMRDRGLLRYIVEPYGGKGRKGVVNVKIDGKRTPCKINDDLADSYCIALYGFLQENKQKLKREIF